MLDRLDGIAAQAVETDGIMLAWPALCELARRYRRSSGDSQWLDIIRSHPIAEIAWQDPFTSWSRQRPRGYPGDARLIDFIYGHAAVEPALAAASPAGRDVHAFTFGADTCVAVRERRRLLAHLVDSTIERVGAPDVLAVACGHLREVEMVRRVREIRRYAALDQDAESLRELQSSYSGHENIETIQAQVGRFIIRPSDYGSFDLIYAAGLYDYLNTRTASRLTVGLFSALKPGGRLLFANFAAGIRDEGYMDALMDWRLILREEADLAAMLSALPENEVARTQLFRGNNGAVIYALAVRK